MPRNHTRKVGVQCYDRVSQRVTRIVAFRRDVTGIYYKLDRNVPLNPTLDGAFPTRWRCAHEVQGLTVYRPRKHFTAY